MRRFLDNIYQTATFHSRSSVLYWTVRAALLSLTLPGFGLKLAPIALGGSVPSVLGS
jgi:hypothetical protein